MGREPTGYFIVSSLTPGALENAAPTVYFGRLLAFGNFEYDIFFYLDRYGRIKLKVYVVFCKTVKVIRDKAPLGSLHLSYGPVDIALKCKLPSR